MTIPTTFCNNRVIPTVLRIGKYRFFFFSNEGKEPPHIHVESGDSYAKFWLEPFELAKSLGYNSKEMSELGRLVKENMELFREKWRVHIGR